MSDYQYKCATCGTFHGHCLEYAHECCAPTPRVRWLCDECNTEHLDEYAADTCCGGRPSAQALEARGQQRIDGL